ncbi:MAG: hypothetical protein ACO3NZ_07235 [Pirellulales bacterium]|jgi:hypothetical protein
MAAKKKSKKSASQQLMGVATMGLPSPVQQVATSKWGSKILLLLLPVLVASGVLTISFNGGKPSVAINEQRAEQVGEELRADALRAAERVREQEPLRLR